MTSPHGMLMTVLGVLLSITGTEDLASAASIKFCFTMDTDFADSGFGLDETTEDHWTSNEPRHLRGARTIIKIGTTTYFDGNLGDGIGTGDPGMGCTTTLTVPIANSTYQFQHYSSGGKIDNLDGGQHTLNALVSEADGPTHDVNMITVMEHTAGAGTFDIKILAGDQETKLWQVQLTAAFVMRRMARWLDPVLADVLIDYDEEASNHYDEGSVFFSVDVAPIKLELARGVHGDFL